MPECLAREGWPEQAGAGIAAYVVNATGKPGAAWEEMWKMRPEDARRYSRSYIRHLTLDVDVD